MNFVDSEARDLLAFYIEAGADALIGEEPVDRMADEAPSPPPIAARPAPPPIPIRNESSRELFQAKAPASPDAAAMAAREAAKTAATLDDLRALLDNFEGCSLRIKRPVLCSPTAIRKAG